MAKWVDTETISRETWDAREREIENLRAILDMRNAAVEALCIALYGKHIPEKSIYDLVFDVDRLIRTGKIERLKDTSQE